MSVFDKAYATIRRYQQLGIASELTLPKILHMLNENAATYFMDAAEKRREIEAAIEQAARLKLSPLTTVASLEALEDMLVNLEDAVEELYDFEFNATARVANAFFRDYSLDMLATRDTLQ